jgi:excisionase family DNA binding protein
MGFSIAETAQLLGVCRQTVYNFVYSGKLKAKRITNRIMIISRENIHEFLQITEPCEKSPAKERKPILEWYSRQEAMSKLNVEFTKYRRIVNENKIPEMKKGVYSFVSKKHIDGYLQKVSEENKIDNRANWITASEIVETYGLSPRGVYSYVSAHGIPKKLLDGQIKVYSKQHIDELRYDTKKENRKAKSNIEI